MVRHMTMKSRLKEVWAVSGLLATTGYVGTNTTAILGIATSNRSYNFYINGPGASGTGASNLSFNFSQLVDMDASDTSTFTLTVQGSGKGVDIIGASAITSLSGFLAV